MPKAISKRGKIVQLSVCPHGNVEGFVVAGTFVKLPPHHDAEAQLATLAAGDMVSVRGEQIARSPNTVLHHVSVRRGGTVVFDHDDIDKHDKPKRAPKYKRLDVTAKVIAVGTRKHGEIDRLLLANNVSVHIHADEVDDVIDTIKPGQQVHVRGTGLAFPRGTFLRADSIERA